MADPINPDHYRLHTAAGDPIEVIDIIASVLTDEEFVGYCRGNALKYICRAGRKHDASTDYQKCRWYLDRLIEIT